MKKKFFMAIIKRHNHVLTKEFIRQIEYVLPKLKYSVYIDQIKNWIENFEAEEASLALEFLFFLEYITFSELQLRIEEQLMRINTHLGKTENILLVPYAAYPKSNDIIMYLLTKTNTYKKLLKEKRIGFTRDISNHKIDKRTVLVFVDDFIGSGKSFKKWYLKTKIFGIIGRNINVSDEQYVLAAIIMEDGELLLRHSFPEIRVFAETRARAFSKLESPFNLLGKRNEIRKLCLKYGSNIQVGFEYPNKKVYQPLGYDDSEALVAFDYGTPNNCVSIIWGNDKWFPIFPRASESRMQKAKEIKTEASFYLGIMNKLGVEINEDKTIPLGIEKAVYNSKEDYSLVVLLILKEKKMNNLQICQILGVTTDELTKIYNKCIKRGVMTRTENLTKLGTDYLYKLKKLARTEEFSFRKNASFEIKTEAVFVPSSFEGKT